MKKDTVMTSVGRDSVANHGIVNPPVYHASTILHQTTADLDAANATPFGGTRYGRRGTPTTFSLEDAVTALEGGFRTIAVGSGLNAITTTLLAFLKNGDHLLMVDSVYGPTRKFCDQVLRGIGVDITYYDPMAGTNVATLMTNRTKVVYCESPGSQTFEIQDIDAIAAVAHAGGAVVIADNTWATGYYYRPLEHGADVSLQAGTKYIVGHSDAMIGLITTNEEMFLQVKNMSAYLGVHAAPDDCYLALRGLRTIAVRLARHNKNGLLIARWLAERPEVETVRHPAFSSCPGHDVWARDFTGSCGLFSIVLKAHSKDAVSAMLDGMQHFKMGYSWGGFESLIIPGVTKRQRTATDWPFTGPALRLHIGLEDPEDLIADLESGCARLSSV